MRASSALRGFAAAVVAMMLMPPAASAGTGVDSSAVRQANQRPTATIQQPTSATTYRVGDVVSYAGSATDPEDGSVANLSWEIAVHRCSNSLCDAPVVVHRASGPNGSFTIANDRGRDSFYTFALTATDSGGQQDTRSVQINPRTAQVTLLTEPPGLKLERDGGVVDSPLAVTATIGSTFSVGAPTPQGGLVFSNWTGGSSRQHDVVVGETNTTDTARFRFPHPTWSLGLNGGTSQARIDHHPELNVTGNWTVEAWFKDEYPDGYNHDNGYIAIKGDTGVNPEIPFQLYISYRKVFAGERVGWTHEVVEYDLAANGVSHGAWHHLAATMEAASRTLILYLDGREVARGVLRGHSTAGNNGPVTIGRNGGAPGWQGKIDDVRIWNVVRTPEQIRDGRLSELGGAPAGLVGNWKFDEGTGTTAGDSAGAGQPATLQGGAAWSPEAQVGPAGPDDPPSISGVTATGVSFTAATITWRTDQNATSQVEYGPTTAYGTTTPVDPAMVRDHTVRLTGLEPNTTYQYRVISTDGSGNRVQSGNYSFATPRDNQPPTISGVQYQQVTHAGATIVWTTSEPADSTVRYGPTASYGLERSAPAMTTSHSVQLTGLQPSTTYHFQAVSEDPSGNEARSTDVTFATAAPPDRQAPQISGVQATSITTAGASIVWNTNEPSDSQVEYGTSASYGTSTPLAANPVVQHSIQLSGLQPKTTYHYRVKSKDAGGNLATSASFTFTTAETPVAARTACGPRPNATVSVAPAGPGRLQVTITAGTSDLLPVNTLEVVRFGAATNALIDAGNQTGRTGGFDVALPAGTRTTSFVVRRAAPGAATTVPLIVVDRCGDWPTMVGGGPSAF